MKSILRLATVCGLSVILQVGCSESNGDGGSAGAGGAAGSGGVQGFDPLDGIGDVELVADGFFFTEGPTWREAEGRLLFTDIPLSTIYELTAMETTEPFRENSGMANGLDSDVDGLLLAAEHQTRRVSRTLADGTIVDVATEYMGDLLNSPNDIAVRSDGTIYFTDPPYGIDPVTEQELDFNGVFRVAPDGALTAEWKGALESRPNGLVLSPDESILYVAETTTGVMMFDVNADGSLANERDFVEMLLGADGMAMDTGGNLFVSAATGVQVYAPDGSLWGAIELPGGAVPANCAFGGADARTLYITARSELFQVRLANAGLY